MSDINSGNAAEMPPHKPPQQAGAPGDTRAPGHYARPMRRPLGGLDRRTQALLAALAAIELGVRLGRTLPLTVLDHSSGAAPDEVELDLSVDAGPLAWHWTEWPGDALQHLCARDALPLLARTRQSRQPDDAFCIELNPPSLNLEVGTAALRLCCRLGEEMLSVVCVCRDGDPWVPACDAIAELYAEILHGLLTQTHIKAAQAPSIGRTSLLQVLGALAGVPHATGTFRAITRLIEDSAECDPSRIAYRFGSRALSYEAFDRLANGLAAQLAARGVQRGAVVPVLLDHSLELPLAAHALMKLGAAFVPLDLQWSEERLNQALDLLASEVVVCAAALPPAWQARTLMIDIDTLEPLAGRPEVPLEADDPAYGVFTAAASGPARCAMNLHGGLANRFRFTSHYFHRDHGVEQVLLNASPASDAAIWQMFWPLTAGGTVVIPGPGAALGPAHLLDTLAHYGVTLTSLEPGMLDQLATIAEFSAVARAQVTSLRELVVDDAAVSPEAARKLCAILPGLRVTQAYGPPETSIGVVFHPLQTDGEAGDAPALGRPLDNCQVIVVDTALRPLPPGACGELLIGGACVGGGYLNDRDATAQAFIDNPFPTLAGAKLFRTGDRGYFDTRGRLRLVGARDSRRASSGTQGIAPGSGGQAPERRQGPQPPQGPADPPGPAARAQEAGSMP